MQHILDILKERGFLAQITFEEDLYKALEKEPMTFYLGIDPTADSLHVGHFIPIIAASHLQKAGHRPIILCGGGTAMIGDPSGKSDLRKMMTKETIAGNVAAIQKQLTRFMDFGEGKAMMVNNGDWLLNLNYIDFLREVGALFSVNRMLTAECYKRRLETGLTFLEFNYMLMQSYDFLHLAREYGCKMQFGGNDQWSNIIGGVELNRRCDNRDVYGMTFTLLTTREGKKMGKTEKGAVWLDPEKTSPYEFFQYWRNIDDCEVQNCLKLLTGVPVKEIDAIDMGNASDVNKAKELLAYELTSLVHSKEDAEKAIATAKRLFSGEMDAEHMPATVVDAALVADGKASVLDLLVAAGLAPSKGEARRLVQQGGISVDGEKVTDVSAVVNAEALGKGIVIKKGKKVYHRITL